MLLQQQCQPFTAQGHALPLLGPPDKFATGGDAGIGHVHAERVLGKTHDMNAALAMKTDKALELVGGVADVLGSDGHDVTSQ
ncbi:hypothetical protein D3C77_763360 [compost metagenome]